MSPAKTALEGQLEDDEGKLTVCDSRLRQRMEGRRRIFRHPLSSRGIKEIENLGGTCDQFDSIDFSKNEIVKLGVSKAEEVTHEPACAKISLEKINGTNVSENVPELVSVDAAK